MFYKKVDYIFRVLAVSLCCREEHYKEFIGRSDEVVNYVGVACRSCKFVAENRVGVGGNVLKSHSVAVPNAEGAGESWVTVVVFFAPSLKTIGSKFAFVYRNWLLFGEVVKGLF